MTDRLSRWPLRLAVVTAGVGVFAVLRVPDRLDGRGDSLSRQVPIRLTEQPSGTDVLLQAISPVDTRIVWVSGHGGTFLRTLDGGSNWEGRVMPGAETLQFRDVDAFDARTAYLMSSGPGELSRIYHTDDGGDTWTLQFLNEHPDGFLDCMAFWDSERGVAYGDAVDGQLFVLRTSDGGESWARVPGGRLPTAQEGEGGFAASGSCVAAGSGGRGWIATGNAARARVLYTEDEGVTWRSLAAPVAGGPSTGLTTVAMLDGRRGIALGGALGDPRPVDNVALTSDGGLTWVRGGRPAMTGPIYGASWVPGADPPTAFAVGPAGVDYSSDGGVTWRPVSRTSYWAVAFASPEAGWAVGPDGRITHFEFTED